MAIEKFAFIDVETTGLDADIHEIIEIGIILTDRKFNELVSFETKVLPLNIEAASARALEINHYDPDVWAKEAVHPHQMILSLNHLLRRTYLAGHNLPFDKKFVEAAYKKAASEGIVAVPTWGTYHTLDTVSLAMPLFVNGRIDRLSLDVVCDYFNVKNEKAHSALSDVRATLDVARHLVEYFE